MKGKALVVLLLSVVVLSTAQHVSGQDENGIEPNDESIDGDSQHR